MQVVWRRRFRPPVVYQTSGTGEWCLSEAEMLVQDLVLVCGVEGYYLLVYFDPNKWDTAEYGYVVNDPGWNQHLQTHLKMLKFSQEAVDALDFDDMSIVDQTQRRVVVPVGDQFVLECEPLVRFLNDPDFDNSPLGC